MNRPEINDLITVRIDDDAGRMFVGRLWKYESVLIQPGGVVTTVLHFKLESKFNPRSAIGKSKFRTIRGANVLGEPFSSTIWVWGDSDCEIELREEKPTRRNG